MSTRHYKLFLILAFCMLAVTGCVDEKKEITLNPDGTGKMDIAHTKKVGLEFEVKDVGAWSSQPLSKDGPKTGVIQGVTVQEEERLEALEQWQDMKFGMLICWGIYSIPAGVWEGKQIEKLGEQIQRHAHIPHDEYAALASKFDPVNFDAEKIVLLAKEAGMKYVVLTAKFHDGFCMFDSKYTEFDIMDSSPYKKDILKLLADACRKHGLKLGVYYSTPDWHFNGPFPEVNPADNKISVFSKVSKANEEYQVNQLRELLTNYGDIVQVFFDMGEPTPAQSKRFADTVRGLQPACMINGRVMNNQGDFIMMPDNHVPDVPVTELPWESPGTFYHTWGYKSWVKGAPLKEQVSKQIQKLVTICARGGNFILNIGPMSDGTVVPYEVDVLRGIADWMKVNKESIFGMGVTPFKKLPWGECTTGKDRLYLHVFDWPSDNKLLVPGLTNTVKAVYPLAVPGMKLSVADNVIDLSGVIKDSNDTVIVLEYEGALNVEPKRAKVIDKRVLVLPGSDAIHHGKYGRESYRSMLADYYRSWDVGTIEAGVYKVSLSYRLNSKEKLFRLEALDSSLSFSLKRKIDKVESMTFDGNEAMYDTMKKEESKTWNRVDLGEILLPKSGPFALYLRQGKEFNLCSTVEDFLNQDHNYRAMKLEIEALILIKIQ